MHAVTLEELIALNDEIRALVRAGVPLDQGLAFVSSNLSGHSGTLAKAISERLSRGETLAEIIEDPQYGLPKVYRAVVVAGIRSGRLSAALEGLSATARRAAELRRVLVASMIYPMLLLAVATFVIWFTSNYSGPVLTKVYESLGVNPPWLHSALIGSTHIGWVEITILWSLILIAIAAWWATSRRGVVLQSNRHFAIPTIRRVKEAGRFATFADTLALLIENRVPLAEAVQLSTEATGDRWLVTAGNSIAAGLRRGVRDIDLPRGFPPLVAWMISSGGNEQHLVRTLRHTSASYRQRAIRMGEWMTHYFPIFLTAGIGGAVTAGFCLAVIAPFYQLLQIIALP